MDASGAASLRRGFKNVDGGPLDPMEASGVDSNSQAVSPPQAQKDVAPCKLAEGWAVDISEDIGISIPAHLATEMPSHIVGDLASPYIFGNTYHINAAPPMLTAAITAVLVFWLAPQYLPGMLWAADMGGTGHWRALAFGTEQLQRARQEVGHETQHQRRGRKSHQQGGILQGGVGGAAWAVDSEVGWTCAYNV